VIGRMLRNAILLCPQNLVQGENTAYYHYTTSPYSCLNASIGFNFEAFRAG